MSCKEKPASKNKHYTLMERKVFLQILEKYKNVVELKKSDATTLKDKDVAWNEICEEYNHSTLICQETNSVLESNSAIKESSRNDIAKPKAQSALNSRTVQQLKKLWANLKQSQRDALTKEKQSRLATGGGPQEVDANIDPDILNIAPHLMETAPALFSSNMSETEMEDKREFTLNVLSTNNLDLLLDGSNIDLTNDETFVNLQDKHECNISTNEKPKKIDNANKKRVIDDENSITIVESQDKHECNTSTTKDVNKDSAYKRHLINIENDKTTAQLSQDTPTSRRFKQSGTDIAQNRKRKYQELSDTEEILRAQRIKEVMKQEQSLAIVKLKHEENVSKIREDHLKHLNEIEAQHKKEINKLEIEINKTKLKILETQCVNKENINLRL